MERWIDRQVHPPIIGVEDVHQHPARDVVSARGIKVKAPWRIGGFGST
jgi:hypothetical protein